MQHGDNASVVSDQDKFKREIRRLQRCNVKFYFVSFVGYRTQKCIFPHHTGILYNFYCHLIYLTTSAELQERERKRGRMMNDVAVDLKQSPHTVHKSEKL